MGSAFDLNCINASTDVFGDATCKPWIEVTVREDDVGILSVLLRVVLSSSECSHGPVIVWSQIVLSSALSSVSSLIEKVVLYDKNGGVGKTHSLWHGELVASQNVPATSGKGSSSGCVSNVVAEFGVVVPVEIDLSSGIEHAHNILISFITSPVSEGLARNIDWITWHWLKER